MFPRIRASYPGARALAAASVALLLVSVVAVRPETAKAAPRAGFVYAQGSNFMLDGRPWHFTGYDLYQLTSQAIGANWNCGGDFGGDWLNWELGQIESDSDSAVIRTWFFQSYSADNYIQFDTVLNAAAAHGVKIIPVLVNQWGECEPNVSGSAEYKSLGWYQTGYRATGDSYPLSFRQYAINLAAHYADNPTIAFWQLVNEAEASPGGGQPCNENAAGAAIRAFADDMTGAIKAADPNHLVSLGTIGSGQCGTSGPDYELVHGGRVDICEYHDYTNTFLPGDPWNGAVDDLAGCAAIGKPTFAGEVGIDASVQPDWSTTGVVTAASLNQRESFFYQKMVAQFGEGLGGFLVWTRNPGTTSAGLEVAPGDPTNTLLAHFQRYLYRQDGWTSSGPTHSIDDPITAVGRSGGPAPSLSPMPMLQSRLAGARAIGSRSSVLQRDPSFRTWLTGRAR
jgi:mannan endo-1,4-beta-mannosidase